MSRSGVKTWLLQKSQYVVPNVIQKSGHKIRDFDNISRQWLGGLFCRIVNLVREGPRTRILGRDNRFRIDKKISAYTLTF